MTHGIAAESSLSSSLGPTWLAFSQRTETPPADIMSAVAVRFQPGRKESILQSLCFSVSAPNNDLAALVPA
jgi:hypothetical protein